MKLSRALKTISSALAKGFHGLCVSTAFIATPLVAAVDLLEQPAIKSSHASQALMLDADIIGNHAVAVGEHGVVLYSQDAGQGWQQAFVPAAVMLTAVDLIDDQTGWAVGHDGLILFSSNGGRSWSKQMDGYSLGQAAVELAAKRAKDWEAAVEKAAEANAREEAEFQLEEAQFVLEGAEDDLKQGPVRPLLDVWFRNRDEGFVTGSYGMLLETRDGGKNWELVSDRLDNPENYHLNKFIQGPDGTLFIVGEAGTIHRSRDDGASWVRLGSGYSGSFFGIVAVPLADQAYELLTFGLRGNLYRSLDGGDSWNRVDIEKEVELSGNMGLPAGWMSSFSLTDGVALSDGSVLLVCNPGTILVREAGKTTFGLASYKDRRPMAAIEQVNDQLLIVGFGGLKLIDLGDINK